MMIGTQTEARDRVRDQRIERIVELVSPAGLLADLPLGGAREKVVVGGRESVERILGREDDRLLVVVGPCSVHDPEAALDYAGRLAEAARGLADELLVAMRVYFEKPRTTIGWKGLINDPHLDGSYDVNTGLRKARTLLLRGPRPRAAGRLRVPRPDHPAVHLRHRRLGRDRGADDREPGPPPARLGPLDAGRVQEPAPTATSRSPSTRSGRPPSRTRSPESTDNGHAGDPPHHAATPTAT